MSTAGDWSRDPLGDAERRRARGAVPWGRAEEAGEEWPPLRAAPPETPPDPQDDVETTSYISSLRDRQSPDGEWYRASPQYGTRAARRREANPADDYGNAVGHEPGPATPPPPAPVSGYRGASDTSGWLPPALPPTTYRKVAPRDDDSTYSTGAHRQVDYDIDGRPMGYRALPSGHEDPPRDLSLDDGTRDDGSYGATTYGASGTTYTGAAGTTYTGTTYGGGDYTPDGRPTAYRALPSGSGDGGYGTYSAGTPFGGGTTYGGGNTYGAGTTYGGGYQDQAYQQQPPQQPAYEQPYEPATYEQPAYDPPRQPAYEQPAYEQPYEQPAYQQPAYEQPYEQPAYEPSGRTSAGTTSRRPTTSAATDATTPGSRPPSTATSRRRPTSGSARTTTPNRRTTRTGSTPTATPAASTTTTAPTTTVRRRSSARRSTPPRTMPRRRTSRRRPATTPGRAAASTVRRPAGTARTSTRRNARPAAAPPRRGGRCRCGRSCRCW